MNWGLITCEREMIHGIAMLTKIAKFSYCNRIILSFNSLWHQSLSYCLATGIF